MLILIHEFLIFYKKNTVSFYYSNIYIKIYKVYQMCGNL